ncbi:hypothetical protein BD414DRAFT_513724 [Trametes punicea]|nr:hypothetical protein BD414DRAFT_513724 [Trametes punicea]
MGGNAFKTLIPDASFPRMPPRVYEALKLSLMPIVQSLYARAVIPREAPEKADYGDLDFVVCGPRDGLTPDGVQAALRATHSASMPGNRTSNFAIAMDAFEDVMRAWKDCAADGQDRSRPDIAEEGVNVYFQVDVNVCADHAQLERTVFCHSYGDLGLILGLLVQTAGLSLSIYGLKLAEPVGNPPRTFYLSTSMSDILSFLGLSMDRWERGFATQEEIFRWVASSPFAIPLAERLKCNDGRPLARNRVEARQMRQKFITYLQEHEYRSLSETAIETSVFATFADKGEKIDAALRYFGKDVEHRALLYREQAGLRARAMLNGRNVQEWTGITGVPARLILDEVKNRLARRVLGLGDSESQVAGEVPAWQRALLDMSDDDVRTFITHVKEEMDAAGKLEYDWRAAKAAKLERKKLKELATGPVDAEEHSAAPSHS